MDTRRRRTLSKGNGSTLSIHNACYEVVAKVPGACCKKTTKKILFDVNGIFKPGMNAILGPTGSGKSSLLDILAGRKEPGGLTGTVLVDGSRQPKNFKCITGYVVQDDVVQGTLTVRENLMFSANLRLPEEVSEREKAARVDETIRELGLEHCADTKVGTEFIRGVSGGERKRTNIGMELIISPPVLFLDEPTTGLDATTANSVMRLLKRLSSTDRTIIFSIHQPRYTIFKQFDYLTLLSMGRLVYQGDAATSLDYFSKLGYVCEEHNNPPDFFLDVIQGDVKRTNQGELNNVHIQPKGSGTIENSDGSLVTSFSEKAQNSNNVTYITMTQKTAGDDDDEETIPPDELSLMLSEAYTRSDCYQRSKTDIDAIYEQYEKRVTAGVEEQTRVEADYATSFTTQARICAARAFKNVSRNPQTTLMQMGMTMMMSVLAGIIYLQLDNDLQSGVQNRAGAFFFTTMNMVFSSMSGIAVFIDERAIFVHENISGFYRVSSYFVAKVFCDMIPMRLLPITVYALVSYFMIGYQVDVAKFFIYFLTIFMTTMVAAGIAFTASGFTPIFAVANLIGVIIAILSMIFGGLLVNVDTLGDWISWMKYLSLFRYAVNALYINEMKDLEFCAYNGTDTLYCDPNVGNAFLESQGIPYKTTWDLWFNHVMLLVLLVFFLTCAYILLRTMKKLK